MYIVYFLMIIIIIFIFYIVVSISPFESFWGMGVNHHF